MSGPNATQLLHIMICWNQVGQKATKIYFDLGAAMQIQYLRQTPQAVINIKSI